MPSHISQISSSETELLLIEHDSISDETHKALDQQVYDQWQETIPLLKEWCPDLAQKAKAYILFDICDTALQQGIELRSFKDSTEAEALINKHPRLGEMVENACNTRQGFKDIRRLRLLRINQNSFTVSSTEEKEPLYKASVKATENSWHQRYIGKAHEALRAHIHHHSKNFLAIYSPYCSIVQSTGTGKSRTVDEFSKENFVIPINLRDPKAQGFPASDAQVYSWIINLKSLETEEQRVRMSSFMFALFEKCDKVVAGAMQHQKNPEAWLREQGTAWFREKMTEGQTMETQGEYRVAFYRDVLRRARELVNSYLQSLQSSHPDSPPTKQNNRFLPDLTLDMEDIVQALINRWGLKDQSHHPIVYLAIDEAHSLTVKVEQTSPLYHLQKLLCILRDTRIFTIFVSTSGQITQLVLPEEDASSSSDRIQSGALREIPPFCALGWDQYASPFPDQLALSSVASLDYKARLGRPLFASRYISSERLEGKERDELRKHLVGFAAQKLVKQEPAFLTGGFTPKQELACLSARMPIEFMSSTSTELDQVTNHMRVCFSVDEPFQQFISLNPSEPVVSDGACYLMNDSRIKFHAPAALSQVLRGFSVHQGDRGELVALLALTMARDRVVLNSKPPIADGVFNVAAFLRALITKPQQDSLSFTDILKAKPSVYRSQEDQNTPLETAFKDVYAYFNHFVKRQEQDKLDEGITKGFIARSAAVLSANTQAGFDMVVFTVQGRNSVVVQGTMGLIIFQVKNDPRFSSDIVHSLFDSMDPVAMGFLEDGDTHKVPIIRIVFALASETRAIHCVGSQRKGNFTSYDIWIAGLGPEVLSVIDSTDQETWDSLLSASRGWKRMYKHDDKDTAALLKNMNPMVASDPEFGAFRGPQK